MSYLEERDLVRLGRDAREWLLAEENRRVIGLVLFSLAISIFMSLMATAIVGFASRRQSATPVDETVGDVPGDGSAAVGEPLGVPVMMIDEAIEKTEAPVET